MVFDKVPAGFQCFCTVSFPFFFTIFQTRAYRACHNSRHLGNSAHCVHMRLHSAYFCMFDRRVLSQMQPEMQPWCTGSNELWLADEVSQKDDAVLVLAICKVNVCLCAHILIHLVVFCCTWGLIPLYYVFGWWISWGHPTLNLHSDSEQYIAPVLQVICRSKSKVLWYAAFDTLSLLSPSRLRHTSSYQLTV